MPTQPGSMQRSSPTTSAGPPAFSPQDDSPGPRYAPCGRNSFSSRHASPPVPGRSNYTFPRTGPGLSPGSDSSPALRHLHKPPKSSVNQASAAQQGTNVGTSPAARPATEPRPKSQTHQKTGSSQTLKPDRWIQAQTLVELVAMVVLVSVVPRITKAHNTTAHPIPPTTTDAATHMLDQRLP